MKKYFNTTGLCFPELHYMVDPEIYVSQIADLITEQKYFVINRARQYGKTTILNALKNKLDHSYCVISISFEGIEDEVFKSTSSFISRFFGLIYDSILYGEVEDISDDIQKEIYRFSLVDSILDFRDMTNLLIKMCRESENPMILMIDEVDQASSHKVFIDFLGQLRSMYLKRMIRPTFHSVILSGVRDIKNLKIEIQSGQGELTNSPWNIAEEFNIDMSLSVLGIEGMLFEYEQDHNTGMDIKKIAENIYEYTSGYPFLVSRICKLMDEECKEQPSWSEAAFLESVRRILLEENTLFDSLNNKLIDYPSLKNMLYDLLIKGKVIEYISGDRGIRIAFMFGFVVIKNSFVYVANRIFETRLYNQFLAEKSRIGSISQVIEQEKSQFISNGQLDMELIISRFLYHYNELFEENHDKFLEDDGRSLFLLYMKPIINGKGNYYIEAHTRNHRRTDVIIDYLGQRYIVELKIWHGEEYNRKGEEQLADYLELYQMNRGYLLSFNLNKKKQVGIKKIMIRDKTIIEAVV